MAIDSLRSTLIPLDWQDSTQHKMVSNMNLLKKLIGALAHAYCNFRIVLRGLCEALSMSEQGCVKVLSGSKIFLKDGGRLL